MDIILTIFYCLILLSVLVFIHEGGHFLAAKMFGVRVTEFMIGLPGPNIGFKYKGTKFGISCILLGGYARVCGMEPGNLSPYLKDVLALVHGRGAVTLSEVVDSLGIAKEDAVDTLNELIEWGSIEKPKNNFDDRMDTVYKASELDGYSIGESREIDDKDDYFLKEYYCQYRCLPFWKRSLILLAGILVNILFAMVVFVILFSIFGFDVQNPDTSEISHICLNPLEAISFGGQYIVAVLVAVFNMINPATAADTLSNSSSLIGIAVISKSAAEQGAWAFMQLMAMISVSLGIMNLLPIPPLDGGRFIVEIYQKIFKKNVSETVMSRISIIGVALILILFFVVTNQDIQRYILGA